MNLKEGTELFRTKILEPKKCMVWNITGYMINSISRLLTGFIEPKIEIDSNYNRYDLYKFKYNIKGGGDYQYNYFYLDSDMKLLKIEGSGKKEITKIFDYINHINFDLYLKCQKQDSLLNSISFNNKFYTKNLLFDSNTFDKINQLDKIHSNLINLPLSEIDNALDILLSYWEYDNFQIKTYNITNIISGQFSNMEIPDIKIKNTEIIIFPDASRSTICSDYILFPDEQMDKILNMDIGCILKVKNKRKGSKEKSYEIVEHNIDDISSTALKNLTNGEIEFATYISLAEDSYDALFPCNRAIYKGWFNKKYTII